MTRVPVSPPWETTGRDRVWRGNNFVKQVSFSPDGLLLLVRTEDSVLRVYDLPTHTFDHSVRTDNPGAPFILGTQRFPRSSS